MRDALCYCMLVFIATACTAQDKPAGHDRTRPQIVFEAKQPFPSGASHVFNGFGKTCKSSRERIGLEQRFDTPKPLFELLGAPIKLLRVREYGDHWKTAVDVEKRLLSVLNRKPDVAFGSVPWAEGVDLDVVATIEFIDKSEGTLEVSSWHACFVDHDHQAWWVSFPGDK